MPRALCHANIPCTGLLRMPRFFGGKGIFAKIPGLAGRDEDNARQGKTGLQPGPNAVLPTKRTVPLRLPSTTTRCPTVRTSVDGSESGIVPTLTHCSSAQNTLRCASSLGPLLLFGFKMARRKAELEARDLNGDSDDEQVARG